MQKAEVAEKMVMAGRIVEMMMMMMMTVQDKVDGVGRSLVHLQVDDDQVMMAVECLSMVVDVDRLDAQNRRRFDQMMSIDCYQHYHLCPSIRLN
jgi:hypothetical protein